MSVNRITDFSNILKIKRYSPNTIKTYSSFLQLFENFFKIKDFENLKDKDLLNYSFVYISKKELAYSSQKHLLSALKLFYKEVFNRYINLDSVRPKQKPLSNPTVFAKNDIKKILNNTVNLKHKAMLSTIYSLGLRSGELINLKVADIDGTRNVIHIKNAKGDKDRILMFSTKLKDLLRVYYLKYKPKEFMFEGQKGGKYSKSSLLKVFKSGQLKAGIKTNASLHSLRHSFATHLLEQGTDISIIQKLLGHNNIKTTQMYLQVSTALIKNIQNPLDTL